MSKIFVFLLCAMEKILGRRCDGEDIRLQTEELDLATVVHLIKVPKKNLKHSEQTHTEKF